MSSLQVDRSLRKRKAANALGEEASCGDSASDLRVDTLEPLQKRIKSVASVLIRPLKVISELFRFDTIPFIRWKSTEAPPACIDEPQSSCDAYAQTEIAADEEPVRARVPNARSPIVTRHHSRNHNHSRNSVRHATHKPNQNGRSHAHEKLGNGNGHVPVVENSAAPRVAKLQQPDQQELKRRTHVWESNKGEHKDKSKQTNRNDEHHRPSPSKNDHKNLLTKHSITTAPFQNFSTQSNASIDIGRVLPFFTSMRPLSRSGPQRTSLYAFHAPTPVSTLITVGASRAVGRERELNDCSSNYSYASKQYSPVRAYPNVNVSPYRLDERDQFRALLQQYTSLNVQLSRSSRLAGTVTPTAQTLRHSVASDASEVITLSSSSSQPHATPNVASRGILGTRIKRSTERVLKDWSSLQATLGSEFVPIPSDAESLIEFAVHGGAPDEVLVDGFRQQLKRSDLLTLHGLNWLNDEVINFYLQMLAERSTRVQSDATARNGAGRNGSRFPKVYSFNTFFYPKLLSGGHASLKRWTKKVDLFDFDLILVPVHLVVHWCLAVIDFRSKTIKYYDSMGTENHTALRAILNYLDAEHRHKKHSALDRRGWRLEHADVPQQLNGSDCGVFACKFADFVARDAPIVFTQQHMPYYRKRMMYELLTKRLLNPY